MLLRGKKSLQRELAGKQARLAALEARIGSMVSYPHYYADEALDLHERIAVLEFKIEDREAQED